MYLTITHLTALVGMTELASARSNGALLVSATEPIKNTKKIGNKGTINQTAF